MSTIDNIALSHTEKEPNKKVQIKQSQSILVPCKIPDFVDIEILKKECKKDIDSNLEYFNDQDITYRISDSKKAEWILGKSIKNSKLIGNGNTNFDIKVNDDICIDVSVLTLHGSCTNEKSIMQNFSKCNDLDTLFNTNKGNDAVDIFKKRFLEKCTIDAKINMYYMIFVCENKNIFFTCLKLNYENIPNMNFSKFTKSCKSIIICNFIDNENGNVKLYKSKKRLELRLCKNIINQDCSIKIF